MNAQETPQCTKQANKEFPAFETIFASRPAGDESEYFVDSWDDCHDCDYNCEECDG